ncbi:hypothetical protein K431DRAFT_236854 [Polychaeton citri CBS 116435]|uniref:C2H2-type domain-containing protein n=1 Tax=Polychaeton citri CBS 116435 TaxID=1314669 RepID=A0A9P4UIZ6_9PEZI|nr:hypothetical protein K431DRAFT_236854 [Polychaeton citri CBS 116435]
MDDQSASMYPPIPDVSSALNPIYPMPQQQMHSLPMVQQQQQQQPPQAPQLLQAQQPQVQLQPPQQQQQQQASLQRSSTSPRSEPSRASNASAASNSKQPQQQKKNQYPCPMAKQVGCNDYFTTSGHAARHAKKHTGKKDAFCPECNKAFTRKDNMEQHRRTHQNGRGTARATEDKVKKNSKQQGKKNSITKSDAQLEAAVEQQLAEQQLSQDPVSAMVMQQSQPQPQLSLQPTLAPALTQQAVEQAMMIPNSTPYFLNSLTDTGPIPALPLVPEHSLRPPLHRANFTNSLEYIPPIAPALLGGDDLHYSYPSPGLSNGLNSLALAASEHRRMSEEKARGDSPKSSPNQTPDKETP